MKQDLIKFLNICFVDVLWLLFSIPLVTVGASTCAANYVLLKLSADEEVHIWKMFVKSFKDNFIQGTFMWIITAACISGLYFIWNAIIKSSDKSKLAIAGAIILSVIAVAVNLYTYALIARYSNSLKNIIRNSAVLCIQYYKKTGILILILAVEFFVFSLNVYTRFAALLIGPGIVLYTISKVAKQIFVIIENTPDSNGETESVLEEQTETEE